MKNFLSRNGVYFAAAIAVAIAVHAASLVMLPHFIMAQTMRKIVGGGAYNVVHHVSRADEHSRVIVRPSPDMLYSICPFDLSKGALRVQASVPQGTYWSVAVFDADTNNIFVENDRQIERAENLFRSLGKAFQGKPEYEGKVDFVIFRAGSASDQLRPPHWIPSPTEKGLVVFRTLINDESRFAEIDKARRKVRCDLEHSLSYQRTN